MKKQKGREYDCPETPLNLLNPLFFQKRALVTISLVWCFSFSANVSSLFLYDTVPIGTRFTCDSTKGPLVDFIYQLYLTFTLLFVPLALMVGLYGNVIITLNTAINSDNPTVEQQIIEKSRSRTVREVPIPIREFQLCRLVPRSRIGS